jgi:NodT family efflux transporter outer membrane factor (OMF) lipoprotein
MATPRPILRATALAVACLAAGCALTEPPSTEALRKEALPNLATPPAWTAADMPPGAVAPRWLAGFADPTLDALVDEAQRHNTDLAVAAARVEQAAASVRIAGATLLPSVGAFARGGTKLSGDLSGLSGAGLTVSWELDLWGRVRYLRRAAQNTFEATEADFAFARQSIAATTAKSWFLAAEATQQLAMARDSLDSAERLLSLADDRLRVGAGAELDVAIARTNAASFRDAVRGIETARQQAIRALETLLGRYPSASLAAPAAWGTLPPRGAAGVPSELLERRPDVVAAERRIAAAWDRVGEARAARLPRLSLVGGVSSISSDLFVLKDFDNPAVSLGANLVAPIFTGGALEGTQELRTAEQRAAVAAWAQTALRAFAEVENALSADASLADRESILRAAADESQRALTLQESRYRVGAGDLRSVSQQQIALYATRMQLLRVQAERRVQRVNLHLALGGDFGAEPAEGATR